MNKLDSIVIHRVEFSDGGMVTIVKMVGHKGEWCNRRKESEGGIFWNACNTDFH